MLATLLLLVLLISLFLSDEATIHDDELRIGASCLVMRVLRKRALAGWVGRKVE
jgi:hypothetical protein